MACANCYRFEGTQCLVCWLEPSERLKKDGGTLDDEDWEGDDAEDDDEEGDEVEDETDDPPAGSGKASDPSGDDKSPKVTAGARKGPQGGCGLLMGPRLPRLVRQLLREAGANLARYNGGPPYEDEHREAGRWLLGAMEEF